MGSDRRKPGQRSPARACRRRARAPRLKLSWVEYPPPVAGCPQRSVRREVVCRTLRRLRRRLFALLRDAKAQIIGLHRGTVEVIGVPDVLLMSAEDVKGRRVWSVGAGPEWRRFLGDLPEARIGGDRLRGDRLVQQRVSVRGYVQHLLILPKVRKGVVAPDAASDGLQDVASNVTNRATNNDNMAKDGGVP